MKTVVPSLIGTQGAAQKVDFYIFNPKRKSSMGSREKRTQRDWFYCIAQSHTDAVTDDRIF